jgi:cell division protein FtsQ
MLKRIINIAFWCLVIVSLPVLLSFVSEKHKQSLCTQINIDIDYTNQMYFLNKEDIIEYLKSKNIYPLNQSLGQINSAEIEKQIAAIAEIKNVNTFKTIDGIVGINIQQKTPLVRIINYNGNSYYLDTDGQYMPLSARYSPRVLVANGYINDPPGYLNIAQIQKDSSLQHLLKADDIWKVAEYINKNEFWKAQIQQIFIAKNGDIELIPVVGNHTIILGDAERIENKFEKLWIFYTRGLKNKSWNNYQTINLKFKNQIVCTKKQ